MMAVPGPSGHPSVSTRVAMDRGPNESVKQFLKFALVGISGVVVNLVVFTLTVLLWLAVAGDLHSLADVRHFGSEIVVKHTGDIARAAGYLANLCGFVVSVFTNYYLNRWWTFRSGNPVARELPKFFTVSVVAYAGNLTVFWLCHAQIGLSLLVSQLLAIVTVMPVNFVANKLWSFREQS
jgi:putative flippase GtrA